MTLAFLVAAAGCFSRDITGTWDRDLASAQLVDDESVIRVTSSGDAGGTRAEVQLAHGVDHDRGPPRRRA
ncbi:MAG TPA: hypothetical protein VGO62_10795 [Myxococcota bacterium]